MNTHTQEFKDIIKSIAPIDFAFIDANHSYDGVSNDFYAIEPFLSSNAIVVFHDTRSHYGPRKFVLHLRENFSNRYDILDLPFGTASRWGITVLSKRNKSNFNLEFGTDGSDIYPKEKLYEQ